AAPAARSARWPRPPAGAPSDRPPTSALPAAANTRPAPPRSTSSNSRSTRPSCNPSLDTAPESWPTRSLEILAVADFFDHAPHSFVGIDREEEVVGGNRARLGAVGALVHLGLQRAAQELRDVGAAHATHDGQHLAVVDRLEQRAAGVALHARLDQLHDLALGLGVRQRHL